MNKFSRIEVFFLSCLLILVTTAIAYIGVLAERGNNIHRVQECTERFMKSNVAFEKAFTFCTLLVYNKEKPMDNEIDLEGKADGQ